MTDGGYADLQPMNPQDASAEEPEHPKTPLTKEDTGFGPSSARKSIGNFSFAIWPPTQRTRDAIIKRLVDTLSAPSVLSKRYGVVPFEEATAAANRIEEEAFAVANASTSPPDDDGIDILQIYSKEISRRMIDTVKSRSASSPAAAADASSAPTEDSASDAGGKAVEDAADKAEA